MYNKTVCFSGHRPEKLPKNGDVNSPEMRRLISVIQHEIIDSIKKGYLNFISGMAKGVDVIAAQLVIEQKKTYANVRLICAIPYKGHSEKDKGIDKWSYGNILANADEVITLCDKYTPGCLKNRNYYMVDNSDKLIAIVSNYKSGTGQTIRYAQKKGLDVKIIKPNEYEPVAL